MTHRFNLFIATLFLLFALPGYWLLFANVSARPPAVPLTIVQLRHLAASLPGQLPVRVEAETITQRRIPQTYFAAGTGFMPVVVSTLAFRLPDADGTATVINSGTSGSAAETGRLGPFDDAAQQRVDAALLTADKVLVTGTGPERTGGLAALMARRAVTDNLWLTPAQLNEVILASQARSTDRRARLVGVGVMAVAPGIVVIPTTGSSDDLDQMIYVRLADGREYLFCGEIAPLTASWTRLRVQSRLAASRDDAESRARNFAWLRTIQSLKREAPGLVIVPGRDASSLGDAPRFSVADKFQ